jgi:Domain of unknown function (DUF397)
VNTHNMDLSHVRWRKGSRSGAQSDCVEVASGLRHLVAVRDSKDPDGPGLVLVPQDWRSFTAQIKAGCFDLA